MEKRVVGIYRKVFPLISETFIVEPTEGMVKYEPVFVTCKQIRKTAHSVVAINAGNKLGVKQALYLLTRAPFLFDDRSKLDQLSLIHGHFGPDGTYAMALAERLKIPFMVTFHGWDITIERVPWKIKSPLYYQLLWHESKLKKKAAVFIAVSKFIESKLLEKGYPREKVIQHYIGIDTDKFVPCKSLPDSRYILCVGRHTEKKGIDTLLKGFAQIAAEYPDVSLLQVGSGDLEGKLKKLADNLNIAGRVKFLGAQPYNEVQRLMRGAEIFALPSQTASNGDSEGLPFVILEAMSSAIPVVSTWHSGIPEAVLDGETGFLVEEKDDQGLADRLDRLLSDRVGAKAMGKKGREVVCKYFDIRKQTRKLENIYDRILANTS